MAVNSIANVYNASTGTWQAQPATITYGTLTTGTGSISVFTGNNTVIGVGTLFKTELGNNYVIRNSANTYVGKIGNVISNTSAVLSKNAAVAITTSAYKFQSYTANVITYDATLGNGNITVYTTNSAVIGTNTTFLTQLDVGYQIFQTVFDTTSVHQNVPNLLGVIRSISSNTRADFTTVSSLNLTNTSFRCYSPKTQNTSNVFPKNMDAIHNSLLTWSRSGLIPGVSQIKSYHPPIPDPVTGVLVNFPATVHTATNTVTGNLNLIDSFGHVGVSNTTGGVQDFDAQNGIVGSSIRHAINSVPINRVVKQLANTDKVTDDQYISTVTNAIKSVYGAPAIPTPPGMVVESPPAGFTAINANMLNTPYTAYQGPGANVVYVLNQSVINSAHNTAADQLALSGNFPPIPRVTDNRVDAQSYFSISNPANDLTDSQRADLAARASNQFSTDSPKRMTITGVPAAIPGLLNVILTDENPANRTYIDPNYNKPRVSAQPLTVNYNPDLPKSPINQPQYEYKING